MPTYCDAEFIAPYIPPLILLTFFMSTDMHIYLETCHEIPSTMAFKDNGVDSAAQRFVFVILHLYLYPSHFDRLY